MEGNEEATDHLVDLVEREVLADLLGLALVLLALHVLFQDEQVGAQQSVDVGPVEVVWLSAPMMKSDRLRMDSDRQFMKLSSWLGKLFRMNREIRFRKLNMFLVNCWMTWSVPLSLRRSSAR